MAGIDAPPIVADLDVNEAPPMVRVERDPTPCRLALASALVLGFDAVGDGVLQEMENRAGHLLDDSGIHLDGFAAYLETDVLASRLGEFSDLSRHPREHLPHRHQPGAGDLATQAAREPLDLRRVVRQAMAEARNLGLNHGEVLRDLRQAPAEDVGMIEAVEIELGEELVHARLGFRNVSIRHGRRTRATISA